MLRPHKKTVEDYMAYDEERVELIDGEFVVMNSPVPRHQDVLGNLYTLLRSQVRRLGIGKVWFSPFDAILSEHNVVQPDLVFLSNESLKRLNPKLEGPPDAAFEVLSESNKKHDLVTKREIYHRFHVQEYWIVDPEAETVTILVWSVEGWMEHGVFKRGESATSVVMKGVTASLDVVFE